MKKLIIYITLLLLTVGNVFSANAQGVFAGRSRSLDSSVRLEMNDDNTFLLTTYLSSNIGKPHTGVWENKDEKTLLLHFDKITDIALLLSTGKVFQGDYEAEILNENELKLDEYVLNKLPWSSKPATLTLRNSTFTFNINDLSYKGAWEQKNNRVWILHLNEKTKIFFPTPDEAYRSTFDIEEFNIMEDADEYIQTKIPWIPEGKDIRLELSNNGTFSFLYRRKFYTGQWSKNAKKEIKLQFDEEPEFKTLWNMGYFEIDKSDPNIFAVFASTPTKYRPLERLQLNKDNTFSYLCSRNIHTGTWSRENNDRIRLSFDKINKLEIKKKYKWDYFKGYIDFEIINNNELKFNYNIFRKQ